MSSSSVALNVYANAAQDLAGLVDRNLHTVPRPKRPTIGTIEIRCLDQLVSRDKVTRMPASIIEQPRDRGAGGVGNHHAAIANL